ncbi:MAG: hypothetical protein KC729_00150 [Candidatus Eisenbacteria bacterium]|uniref:Uncharacterized protein n=1 Tax=Eiseniibacteriota bacterium TaxID=2212470 RepID=A0A956LVG5_UNCEI|nr:hypothetical protein [Candidatus Eisenbacteria bacterium]
MTATHAIYASATPELSRVLIEIQEDGGQWLDFNALTGGNQYETGLRTLPVVTSRMEAGKQIIIDEISSLTMANDPYEDKPYGIFDAPIGPSSPLTINGYTFTGWVGRYVRVRIAVASTGSSISTLGYWLIYDVQTTNREATLLLRSPLSTLANKSAETVKEGGQWYLGAHLSFLVERLLQASTPSGVASIAVSDLTRPVASAAVPSSWGPCPGYTGATGMSIERWVPKCFAADPNDEDILYVGFVVPDRQDQRSGGLGRFNIVRGRWEWITTPDQSTSLRAWYPVAMTARDVSGTVYLSVMTVEQGNVSQDTSARWLMRQSLWTAADGVISGSPSANKSMWGAFETLRKGIQAIPGGIAYYYCGYNDGLGSSAEQYYGEPPMVPFPQHVSQTFDSVLGNTVSLKTSLWFGYTPEPALGTYYTADNQYGIDDESFPVGSYIFFIAANLSATAYGHFRYYLSTAFRGRPLQHDDSWYWIAKNAGTHQYALAKGDWNDIDTDPDSDNFTLGGTEPMWDRQILAWSLAPSNTSTTDFYGWLSTIEWNESASATIPWSRAAIYWIRRTVAGVVTTGGPLWSETPTGETPDNARMIVDLYNPTLQSGGSGGSNSCGAVIGVVLNRANVAGLAYGLAVLKGTSPTNLTVLQMLGTSGYKGPRSGMPFSGFTTIASTINTATVQFIDQATGTVWQVVINTFTTSVTWTQLADGRPVHPIEHYVATDYGVRMTGSDGYGRSLWGMAPGLLPPMTHEDWTYDAAKPASQHHVPGLYPLVQLSQVIAPVLEVADFSGMNCREALEAILELCPDFRLRHSTTAQSIVVDERVEDTSIATLKDIEEYGVVNPQDNDELPAEPGYLRRISYDDVATSVEVVPYETASTGEPQVERLKAGYSTFAGEFLVRSRTPRPMRVEIVSVHGNDPTAGGDYETMISAGMFRWRRLAEVAQCYLAVAVVSSAVAITVRGITKKGGRYFAGEQELQSRGKVRVLDGPLRDYIITADSPSQQAIILTLTSSVGVNAPIYSEVEIHPALEWESSTGPNGVAQLVGAISNSSTTWQVTDTSQLAAGMIVQVDGEFCTVERVIGTVGSWDTGYVEVNARGEWGSVAEAHDAGTPLLGYVSVRQVNKLHRLGGTGLEFGIAVDDNLSIAERKLYPGDGVVIETPGYRTAEMKHRSYRHNLSAGIAALSGERRDRKIQNRFVNDVYAPILAEAHATRDKDPRLMAEGVVIPLFPSAFAGATVAMQAKRLVSDGSATNYEILGARHDLGNWTTTVDLRAFDAITTAAKSPDTDTGLESGGGFVAAGRTRRR